MARRTAPPRFVVRTMVTTFSTVGFIVAGVLLALSFVVRERVRTTVVDRLENGQRILSALEQRRRADMQAEAAVLAESPTIKAALDTYSAERGATAHRQDLVATVQHEVDNLADRIHPDVLAIEDAGAAVIAVAGRDARQWPGGRGVTRGIISEGTSAFRVASAPLRIGDTVIGTLYLAVALDAGYAAQLAAVSGAHTLVLAHGDIVATTLPERTVADLPSDAGERLASANTVSLAGEQYAVRRLYRDNDAAVFTLDSIDAAAAPVISAGFRAVLLIGLGAFVLAGVASLWLSRSVARPIDMLSRSLVEMTTSRTFDAPVELTGSSREMDALADAFNTLMTSLAAAEAETRSAYVGAIRALALALDARDPYTAGHSERVSAISVAMGQHLALPERDIDILRLGALLHDIGKIGIPDDVLRKPGSLTAEEFDLIKQHPVTGARILRSVPFLAAHLPIVELHHERPDGKGYPYGLRSEEIPPLARIVHVADAFDAITSARAYRPARGASEGLAELWRWAGSQFDAEAVQALAAVVPTLRVEPHPIDSAAARAARRSAFVAFSRP